MDPATLVAVMSGAQASRTQMALAAEMLRMNAQASGMVAKIVESAQANLKSLANVADGVGRNVNIVA
jgi:hypothetical protein